MKNAVALNIDLNTKTKSDFTAFNLACDKGYLDVVNILMDNSDALGIDIYTQNSSMQGSIVIGQKFGKLVALSIDIPNHNRK